MAGRDGRNEWQAANRVSQRLAHSSTHRNAGGLNFRVRDGYGCGPAAVAALTPTCGFEPQLCAMRRSVDTETVSYVRSSLRLDSFNEPQCSMNGGFGLLVLAG